MTDTVPVSFEVLEVERFDRGPIMADARVRVEIAGIELELQGVTMRRSGRGAADIIPPQFRCPRTGRWFPAVVLPQELWDAIATEIGEAVTGKVVRLVGTCC